ncbi:tetratricopeptide repeat protein [Anaeromyxobacter oryzisoli]|uniref:tetratricopeptide repeat protein n=1 Tax=Anaeromyxobacter oryzisoli TaxID=2925408 RepID=UPI001F590B74|nr:tetratricopeptide repeat protein [Anaeromyxobacter sp. SG63]
MLRVAVPAALVLGIAAALALPAIGAAGAAESWYLARGRANMRIANYGAAIEAFQRAVEADPSSREASRELGIAYQKNGETDRAVAQLDRHLARFPDDAALAFEQARILQWSRYRYRAKDAIRYLAMGLQVRDDPERRRDLARLLARDRATLDDALVQYRKLLAARPGDRPLRDEYLKLLLWDRRHRDEAIAELQRRAAEDPRDELVERELARLVGDDPRRAAEAADRYGALLARHPGDASLRLARARALARAGRRAEAREEYARALAARPSIDARLEYADLLAGEPGSRAAARAEYEAILRESPRSRRARLGYARVLGASKETSREAIAQYQQVLAEAPRDPEAHRGLARAYAWAGDADQALAHGALADRYGPRRREIAQLERDLRVGREPSAGSGARAVVQPGGSGYGLAGLAAFVAGSAEPTPFTSSAVEAGLETLRGAGTRAQGTYLSVRGEWRPEAGWKLDGAIAYEAARRAGQGVTGELALGHEDDGGALSLTLARRPRRDSLRAFAGELVGGRVAGAASDHVLELQVVRNLGALRLEGSARAGVVLAASGPADAMGGAGLRAMLAVVRAGGWTVSGGLAARAEGYARDRSGLGDATDPLAARFFSPPLFLVASPRISAVQDAGPVGRVEIDAGPALQYVAGPRGGVRAGGELRASLARRVGDRLRLGAEARAERVADVYARYEGALSAALLF